MNHHHSGHPRNRRSVAQRWIFFPTCLVALASLLCTPLIGAGQYTGRNHALVFHRHHIINVASLEAARRLVSQERQDSEERHVSILPQPVPIPGGINLPPLIHVFAPSDLDTEPNVVTNFKGFSALAFPTGTNAARDSNGNFYDVSNDMRVFQGEYVAADGSHHRGTFVFI
jgi:hypothetical protein